MKEQIRTAALEVFDEKGYHKTGIRDIAARAGCSLPTLYYYYGNKAQMYTEIVCQSYEGLVTGIIDQTPEELSLRELWFFNVMQRRMLGDNERRVFRLALKAMLGLDNPGEAAERLLTFDRECRQKDRARVISETGNPDFARLVLRVTDQMLQSAIWGNDGISAKAIRRELDILFDAAPESSNRKGR